MLEERRDRRGNPGNKQRQLCWRISIYCIASSDSPGLRLRRSWLAFLAMTGIL